MDKRSQLKEFEDKSDNAYFSTIYSFCLGGIFLVPMVYLYDERKDNLFIIPGILSAVCVGYSVYSYIQSKRLDKEVGELEKKLF